MLLTPSFASPVSPDPTPIPLLFPPAPAGAAVPADPALPGAAPADFAALFAGLAPEPKPQLAAPVAGVMPTPRGEGVAPRGDLWTTSEGDEVEPGMTAVPAGLSESAVAPVPQPETLPASLPVFVSTRGPQIAEARSPVSARRGEPAVPRDLPCALALSDDPEAPRAELPAEALAAALAFAGLPLSPAVATETAETPEAPTDADAMADEEPETPDAEPAVASAPSPTPRPDVSFGFAQIAPIAARPPVAAPLRETAARPTLVAPAAIQLEAVPVQPRERIAPAPVADAGHRMEMPAPESAAAVVERVSVSPADESQPRADVFSVVPPPIPATTRPAVQSSPAPTKERPMLSDVITPAPSAPAAIALPPTAAARGAVQLRAVAVAHPVPVARAEIASAAPVAGDRDVPADSFAAEPRVTSSSRLAAWAQAAAATALPAVPANIAAPVRVTAESISFPGENEFKTFVNAREQELTPRSETLGIAVANLPATMPPALAAAPDAHPTFEYAGAWPVATAPEFAVAATPAGMTAGELDAPRAAHRAVESVLSTVDRLADAPRQSVELDFSVGDVELAVRVELRGEEVRTTFRTDSPELRAALSQEWQSAAASHQGERAVRFAAPVISGSDQPPAQGFGGDAAFSQQHGRQLRHGGTDTPQFAGASVRPSASAAPAAPAPAAVAAPVSAPGARRLNRFA